MPLIIYVHKSTKEQEQQDNEAYHCHVPSHHLLLYGNNEDSFIKLFDLTNGTIKMNCDVGLLLQPLLFSTPIAWSSNEGVILHSTKRLQLWDIGQPQPVQMSHLPSMGRHVRAFATVKDFNDNQVQCENWS